jgi:TPR repeat protein
MHSDLIAEDISALRTAAEQGDRDAQFRSAIAVNDTRAARYYQLAADQGHTIAQCKYAVLIAQGTGVAMNRSRAAHYSNSPPIRGIPTPRKVLYGGTCLFTGDVVAIDKALAAQYHKLSADQGNVTP